MTTQFGDYTLTAKLGQGDMGTIYKATHPDEAEPVALKILDKLDTSDAMKRGAAVEVIEFAATLSHERLHPISAVLDSPDDNDLIGIVMPLAGVASLGTMQARGKQIPAKMRSKLISQVASGLAFLHGQEVAHGGIKPNNILLDKQGNVTLTDLTMATLRELGFVPPRPTDQHMLFKQPEREYHAPPEIEGDVYALSVLSYLLLAGEMPFSEPEPEARGVIPQGSLSPTVAAVLRRAMNPHLRLRYKTVPEFMNALKGAIQGQIDEETEELFGVKAQPPSPDDLG